MNSIDTSTPLPEPWYWTDHDLTKQLQVELSDDHLLKSRQVKTQARRQDNDDVLFELEDGSFAIVHLTWQQKAHDSPAWPRTDLYDSWEKVLAIILGDAEDFEEED